MKKILLIEDNLDVRENTAEILELANYKVYTAPDGKEGVEMARKEKPDLIICDIMMPGLDGYGVLHMLSKDTDINAVPFIFLTAKAERSDMRKGMDLGADDYITKPIRPRLLVSKVEALLRRAGRIHPNSDTEIITANIIVNRERFLIIKDDIEIQLPKKEFELIELLASRPGKVFTREQILSTVWGDETIVGERTIDVHIRKLREKLGESHIRTVKGVGYTYTE
jgi:two-component system alkaline phosphatase synthesis response regulator PhoP